MPAAEVHVDSALVSRLLESQFPQWAHLEPVPVSSPGWDNALFRLGPDLVVRPPDAGWQPRPPACRWPHETARPGVTSPRWNTSSTPPPQPPPGTTHCDCPSGRAWALALALAYLANSEDNPVVSAIGHRTMQAVIHPD
jgi:hypothetical protein